MKKKIKDLTLVDIPKCWDKLFKLNPSLMGFYTYDQSEFDYFKKTIPNDVANIEIEWEDEQ